MAFITKRKLGLGEGKDIENSLANHERATAMLEYIAVCDYPEILEETEGGDTTEEEVEE